jgi:hypothetical protein
MEETESCLERLCRRTARTSRMIPIAVMEIQPAMEAVVLPADRNSSMLFIWQNNHPGLHPKIRRLHHRLRRRYQARARPVRSTLRHTRVVVQQTLRILQVLLVHQSRGILQLFLPAVQANTLGRRSLQVLVQPDRCIHRLRRIVVRPCPQNRRTLQVRVQSVRYTHR